MRFAPRLAAGLLGAALLLGGGLGGAQACAICLSAVSVSTGQKLDAADVVALATPVAGSEQFRITEAVKGDAVLGTVVEAGSDHAENFPAGAGKLSLLARNAMSGRWTHVGALGAENAAWLRELLKTNDGRAKAPPRLWPIVSPVQAVTDSTNWPRRIALIEPYLECDDPLAAEIAFGELSRAPYEAMRGLRPVLDAEDIRVWIEDPALSRRHDAYLLLLGIAGGADDAAMIEKRLVAARAAHDATHVAAILAADIELRGPSQVGWIEKNYLLDHGRSLPEIDAALLALNVHGAAGGVVSRQRVVDAYRDFIRDRKPMAGFVATYLSDWKAWDAVPPTDEELATWYAAHKAEFTKPPRVRFRHLYFSNDKRGQGTRQAAEASLPLVAGRAPASLSESDIADPFMFRDNYVDVTPEQMAKEFGGPFAKALFELQPGDWRGPIESGYGWHLVWIDSYEAPHVPTMEEVRPVVAQAWQGEKYREVKQRAMDEIRSRYEVIVPPLDTLNLDDLTVRPSNPGTLGSD